MRVIPRTYYHFESRWQQFAFAFPTATVLRLAFELRFMIYRSDNLLQTYHLGELLISIYFLRRGLYRCIEPSNFRNIYMKLPAAAGIFIYISEIYTKMPAAASNLIYISMTSKNSNRHEQNAALHMPEALILRPSPPKFTG